MIRVECPCVGDTFIQRLTARWGANLENISTTADNINFGTSSQYVINNSTRMELSNNTLYTNEMRTFLQFDMERIANINRRILNIELNHQYQNSPNAPSGGIVRSVVFTGNPLNIERIITFNNSNQMISSIPGNTVNFELPAVSGLPWTLLTLSLMGLYNNIFLQNNIYSIIIDAHASSNNGSANFTSRESTFAGSIAPFITVDFETIPGTAPINLLPESSQNPRGTIALTWWYIPSEDMPFPDIHLESEIEIWQGSGSSQLISISGGLNEYILPANFFTTYEIVSFRVRTREEFNGWSNFSEAASFELSETPPLAPILIYPINISVSGSNGVLLEWGYNSPFDIFPSRFDIRYRIDNGIWNEITNLAEGSLPARASALTSPINVQARVEWQVRAYGKLGDVSVWSDVATFFIIGAPPAPVIVSVENSNRPIVHFSTESPMAYDIEILKNNEVIYSTESHVFLGEFFHVASILIPNGNYMVRMRVINEFGYESPWAYLPFTINTIPPKALKLSIARNNRFFISLKFENKENQTAYIYRREIDEVDFKRIAVTEFEFYSDYAVVPGKRYEYFLRVVGLGFSFSDSKRETGLVDFSETIISTSNTPWDLMTLSLQLDREPSESMSFGKENSLTYFAGREKPVLQVGSNIKKSASLSFYCNEVELKRLSELKSKASVLMLRSRSIGLIYGTISGEVSLEYDNLKGGFIVRFVFTETDYKDEVDII